ncbi:hypothetical protein [Allokutzneria albata]|uniref:Uncharacterized protein n=1 Tax=Allokutzneria albata TaxID=211114 RepID=A0A1H0DVC0_ALLAB|nr:hypothetical protein [Allokutzneria albata]SDN73931.1 hypothetical protein SAMN04489726_8007 [Allokutzneria albata]
MWLGIKPWEMDLLSREDFLMCKALVEQRKADIRREQAQTAANKRAGR